MVQNGGFESCFEGPENPVLPLPSYYRREKHSFLAHSTQSGSFYLSCVLAFSVEFHLERERKFRES